MNLPSTVLGLSLGVHDELLRFYSPDGALIPTLAESVAQEQTRAAQQWARAERLAERLRAVGIDPDGPSCEIRRAGS